jgi:hypothetical protein
VLKETHGEVYLAIRVSLYLAADGSGALFFERGARFLHPKPLGVTIPLMRVLPDREPDYFQRRLKREGIGVTVVVSRELWPPAEEMLTMIMDQAEVGALEFILRERSLTCEKCAGHEFYRDGRILRCLLCRHLPAGTPTA